MAKRNRLKNREGAAIEPLPLRSFDIWPKAPFSWPRNPFTGWPGFADLSLGTVPDVDMVDEGENLKVTVDLPGIKKEDIKLNVDKESITISANTRKEKEEKGKSYYYSERSSAGYYRRVQLPIPVRPESSRAKFESGSLEITIKKEGKPSGRSVAVE